jgi:hypothetical protein
MRKNKKNSRKASRKCYRKNKKQAGGSPMAQSLVQGKQFAEFHPNQHGGALTGAPLSQIDGSMLEPGLRDFARVGGLDASMAAAATQRDPDQMPQHGGRRTGRKNKKASKKSKNKKASKKSKKNRKASKKSRRQAGGALTGAPFNGPTMLLTPAEAARAGTADFSNPLLKH